MNVRVLGLMLALLWAGWTQAQTRILVSVRPIELLVNELTQDLAVEVVRLLPAGMTPHDYAVKPSDMRTIADADLVVWLGPASEPYLRKLLNQQAKSLAWEALPGLSTLPQRQNLMQEAHVDATDAEGHHQHESAPFDLHLWFSVHNAQQLALALEQRLTRLLPEHRAQIQQNRLLQQQRLAQQLERLRHQLSNLSPVFLVYHDAYQYLEQDVGVAPLGAIMPSPEIKPGIKHLMALKAAVKVQTIGCVIVEPGSDTAFLRKLENGDLLATVSIDPMAWDTTANLYSHWLEAAYGQLLKCFND